MVGIVSYGLYLPEHVVTSSDISKISGIPREVIEEKQGWRVKRISRRDEMPSEMALKAVAIAVEVSEKLGIGPSDIKAILYVGSEFKDYGVWMMSTRIQDMIGARGAFAFDIAAMCAGYIVGLAIAKRINDLAENVLLVAASKESYLVNYRNPNTTWVSDFADGASAMVVSRSYARNRVLESSFISDGRFWDLVVVKSLGAVIFRDQGDLESIERPYFDSLVDKDQVRSDLSGTSKNNFVRVIREALDRSGYTAKETDLLVLNHMKRSFHREIVRELGINEARAPYLEEYGHIQSSDMVVGLDMGIKRGLVKNGSIVVLASGGTGFIWGATVLRWG